jgi:CBS domain-containing protein
MNHASKWFGTPPAIGRELGDSAMSVAGVMTRDVVTVTPNDRAWTVSELLNRLGITGMPVVDDRNHVVGVVSELDLLRALRHAADLRRTPVSEVMQARPFFVPSDTDLLTAAALMDEWQVRRLPVCDDGRLAGIISRGDLLRALTSGGSNARLRHAHQKISCGSGRPCHCVSASVGLAATTGVTNDDR